MTDYISEVTITVIGEGKKTLPFLHKTKNYTGEYDDLIEVSIVCSAGTHIIPLKFFYETTNYETVEEQNEIIRDVMETAKEVEPYASIISSLTEEKWKMVDVVFSPLKIGNLH
jgi:hypothetical protein